MAPKNGKKKQLAIGEGRRKVGDVYRSGQYKGKTRNLTEKQVAAGRRVGKAGKAKVGAKTAKRAMSEVKIQNTTWKKASERTGPRAKGGILLNKDGKPVTGTVTLASGAKATYVRGKRVAAQKPKPKSNSTRTTQSRAASIPTTRPSAAQTGAGAGGRTGPGPSAQQVAAQARQRRNQNRPPQSLRPTTTKPARGARRKVRQGDFVITYEWDGTRWTQAQKTRVTG